MPSVLNCLKADVDEEMKQKAQGKKRKKTYSKNMAVSAAYENQYETSRETGTRESGSSLEDFQICKQIRNPPVSTTVSLNERHPSDSTTSQISGTMSNMSSAASLTLQTQSSKTDESVTTENEYENCRIGAYENITPREELKYISAMEKNDTQINLNKHPQEGATCEDVAAPCLPTDPMGYLEPKGTKRDSRVSGDSESMANVPRTNEAFYLTPKPRRRGSKAGVSYFALSEPLHLNRKSTISTFEKVKNFFMRRRKSHVSCDDVEAQRATEYDRDFLCVTSMPELTRLLPANELDLDGDGDRESCAESGHHRSFHRLNTKSDVLLIRKELKRNGKNGSFVLTTLAMHPLHPFTMHVLINETVYYYPIAKTDQDKFSLEPLGKQFSCMCKLITHYGKNNLPNKQASLTSQMVPALPVCDMENFYEDVDQG